MARTQVLKNLHPVMTFELKGQEEILTVKEIRDNIETQFGKCSMIDFVDGEGEIQSIFMGAALKLFDWNALMGQKIALVYQGKVKNKATKRSYDDFEIYILDEKDSPALAELA